MTTKSASLSHVSPIVRGSATRRLHWLGLLRRFAKRGSAAGETPAHKGKTARTKNRRFAGLRSTYGHPSEQAARAVEAGLHERPTAVVGV